MQEIDLVRVLLAVSFFGYASVSDWRTRRVKDVTWIVLGSVSLLLLWANLFREGASLLAQSLLLPIAFVFYDIFWERDEGLRGGAGAAAIALYISSFAWVIYVALTSWSAETSPLLIAFGMIILFELFYMFDVIKGGADAKGLICLAVLIPEYPALAEGLPIIRPGLEGVTTVFTFSLSVLFVAALISVAVPLYFLARNLRSGGRLTLRSFVGFQMPLDEVERRFVWLLERVEDGKARFSARRPRETETLKEDIERLRALGRSEAWVTYKIPFFIPMTAAVVLVLLLGNPLFVLY